MLRGKTHEKDNAMSKNNVDITELHEITPNYFLFTICTEEKNCEIPFSSFICGLKKYYTRKTIKTWFNNRHERTRRFSVK